MKCFLFDDSLSLFEGNCNENIMDAMIKLKAQNITNTYRKQVWDYKKQNQLRASIFQLSWKLNCRKSSELHHSNDQNCFLNRSMGATNNLEMPKKIHTISVGCSSSFSDIQAHTDVKKQLQTSQEMWDIIILKSQRGTRKSSLNVLCSLFH